LEHNAKVSKFYSRFWNHSSHDIDAFTAFWGDSFGLFVPPISIIDRVLRKMSVDKAKGILVVLLWKLAPLWPLLCPHGQFIKAIINWIDLPVGKENYVSCKNGKGIFGNMNLKFRMLALYVDFTHLL
jgi:hypothetical protein